MTEQDKTTESDQPTTDKKEENLTEEELREKKIQERIAELRKRDPFIYR